jgi:histidinol dehydrogenase
MRVLRGLPDALAFFRAQRSIEPDDVLIASVMNVLTQVRERGDAAVFEFIQRYDGVALSDLRVPLGAFSSATQDVPADLRSAIRVAAERVRAFYSHQPKGGFIYQDGGATLGQLVRPLERVACYVPGGQAPLFSTLLMTAIPAQLAGVPEVVVASPPDKRGLVPAEVLAAAREIGVSTVYRMGGPVAIAALAYGTESVQKVDKIVGPGSTMTMLAKKLVFGEVGIEALPGPTETMVVADGAADARHVAADLLAQAEHVGAQPVLVTPDAGLLSRVEAELERQLAALPDPYTASDSLASRGVAVLVASLAEAVAVANAYAPEHLCLLVEDPWALVPGVKHAGGLFIGPYSMEAMGDYLAGPSHVMPTGGTARFSSAINLRDFQKIIPFVSMGAGAVAKLGPAAARMARAEGLEAHARAIESRIAEG